MHYSKIYILIRASLRFDFTIKSVRLEDYNHYYELGEKKKESIAAYDVVLMRKDHLFDMNFVYTTYILEQAECEGAWIINKPQSLRDLQRKIVRHPVPELQVPTLVTSNEGLIREFLKEQVDVIVKPLMWDGAGIFRLYQMASILDRLLKC